MKKICLVKPDLYLPESLTIVGSSKIILTNKFGTEIDNSQYVVRFNFAKTEGYEIHTGSKTSLLVINNHVYQSFIRDKKKNDELKKYLVISPYSENKNILTPNLFFFEKKKKSVFFGIKVYKIFWYFY